MVQRRLLCTKLLWNWHLACTCGEKSAKLGRKAQGVEVSDILIGSDLDHTTVLIFFNDTLFCRVSKKWVQNKMTSSPLVVRFLKQRRHLVVKKWYCKTDSWTRDLTVCPQHLLGSSSSIGNLLWHSSQNKHSKMSHILQRCSPWECHSDLHPVILQADCNRWVKKQEFDFVSVGPRF